jgi:hypothetical protein
MSFVVPAQDDGRADLKGRPYTALRLDAGLRDSQVVVAGVNCGHFNSGGLSWARSLVWG